MNKLKFLWGVFIVSALFLTSCKDDDSVTPEVRKEKLVGVDFVRSYSTEEARGAFTLLQETYPNFSQLSSKVKTGIDVYKIVYKTQFKEQTIQVSAIVAIPNTDGEYPIVSFQNGTNTLHSNAPSVNLTNTLYQNLLLTATTGFVVAIPDYIGFGASDNITPHPYFHKESTIQTVIDMLKSIREIKSTLRNPVDIKKDVFLMGYSQGGWATLALHNAIETNYSSEFNLRASLCGAGAYNIWAINQQVVSLPLYSQPYFVAYLVAAHKSLRSFTNPISDIFKAPYDARVLNLFNGKNTGDQINAQLTFSIPDLFTDEYRTGLNEPKFSTVKSTLISNSVAPWNTSIPVRFVHGTTDTAVPFTSSQGMYQAMQTAGTAANKVALVPLAGLGHSEAIIPSVLNGFLWFNELNQ
ncbi:MAG: alpha/beta hydrolase [Bacteroidales bacterium]|nr:alpha/beta hydrolase [Bacteroidales bacterium]